MNWKTINTSREIRLWLGLAIAGLVAVNAVAPEIKDFTKDKAKQLKSKLSKSSSEDPS